MVVVVALTVLVSPTTTVVSMATVTDPFADPFETGIIGVPVVMSLTSSKQCARGCQASIVYIMIND